ncbi:MAG: hypothetical protein AAF845_05265 [Bacteroidota bacterium]
MAEWFQVYSDDAVLNGARRDARRIAIGFAVASGVLVASAPVVGVLWPGHASLIAAISLVVLTFCALATIGCLGACHRRVWRVDLSVRQAVGHDAGGRRLALPWTALDRVDVGDDALTLTGRSEDGRAVRIDVPASMPDFAALSHRAVEYAEAFRRPICVDGRPWEALDLTVLYPSIRATGAPEP